MQISANSSMLEQHIMTFVLTIITDAHSTRYTRLNLDWSQHRIAGMYGCRIVPVLLGYKCPSFQSFLVVKATTIKLQIF